MKTNALGDKLRRQEVYHSLRVPLGVWTIVRVDGCGFSKLTASHFDKPFDSRFSDAMTCAARALVERLQGVYAYTESDEISLLLPPEWNLYDREVEKTVSLSAAIASATLANQRCRVNCGCPLMFSCIWVATSCSGVLTLWHNC